MGVTEHSDDAHFGSRTRPPAPCAQEIQEREEGSGRPLAVQEAARVLKRITATLYNSVTLKPSVHQEPALIATS